MKYLGILFMATILLACKKENDPYEGDHFICYVGNRYFEADGDYGCSPQSLQFGWKDSTGYESLSLYGTNCNTDDYFSLGIVIWDIRKNKLLYSVEKDSLMVRFSPYYQESPTLIDGFVFFADIEPPVRSGDVYEEPEAEGVFNFTVVTPEGDTVKISEGSFAFIDEYD